MKSIAIFFVATLVIVLSGCARAHDQYRWGCITYGYCPPAPLPYASYCGCPTPLAEAYRAANVADFTMSDQPDAESAAVDSGLP
jgi:hypothetical protein